MTSKQITKHFNELRKGKHYAELGWFMWTLFTMLPSGSRRKTADELWDSMSKREQNRADGARFES